ncbi:MAG: NAD(P)-binding protein, partial [Chloroflexota bacterium]|nr:NAD(P)-binding protein [Chloroflexota bacterium]
MKKLSINSKWRYFRRQAQATIRDTGLLLSEFQWPLLAFAGAVLGGGMLYNYLSIQSGEPIGGLVKSIYHVLGLVFLSPLGEFPNTWYLQIFYFLIPIIGISILAQGVADFGILLFNRQARGKEWEMAVASTFDNHVIVIGLGHLGYRVVQHLHSMEEEVVAIELNPEADLAASVKDLGIPVIADDAARESILTAANVSQARAIMLCTQNDSLNLQIALKARDLNPNIQVVIRIFDNGFAHSLQEQFGFHAMSTT